MSGRDLTGSHHEGYALQTSRACVTEAMYGFVQSQ